MALYSIDESTMKGLANAIRLVNGETRTYTATEMIEAVTTIMESATYILVDENGTEVPAIYVDNEVVFTADEDDIREGETAASYDGVVVGTKEIPAYITTEGIQLVSAGSTMVIKPKDGKHAYTKLLAVICPYQSSIAESVAVEKSCIEDVVYPVASNEILANVTIDEDTKTINLGIVNEADTSVIIRYFSYKEEL